MRASILIALLVPTIANAAPKKTVVWQNRVVDNRAIAPLASVSHTLYLNDCKNSTCTVAPGFDNSITNKSSIASQTTTLSAWSHGQAQWDALLDCVKETFKPFDINIVTTNPGSASHFEVMVGGTSQQLNPNLEAGGVAPFIGCGASENNVISFVFAAQTGDINFLCGAVAQEAAHVWGLDHELDADDPMTYLNLGSLKRFQNSNPKCGEELADPRFCNCGGSTQNSFVYMRDAFGLNPNLGPMTAALVKPRDGQWVAPEFPIAGTMESELTLKGGTLKLDTTVFDQFENTGVLAWNAPASLTPGKHTIKLDVADAADRTASASIDVNVMAKCNAGACASGFACLEGLCVPGADETGGLGATCATNDECATNKCASDGTQSLCTGACDADGSCPSGFECIVDANTCWPTGDGGGGGCDAGGGGKSAAWLLVALGAVLVQRRRR
jgi:uncharacterized protein (TIGR03382 family)